MDPELGEAIFNAVELMQMAAGYATSMMQLGVTELAMQGNDSPQLKEARRLALERCYDGAQRLKKAMDEVVLVARSERKEPN